MRIIRTSSNRQPFAKGWVREGVLSSLSKEPSTLTEISSKLGVSKSTASYHLSLLLGRGVIEEVGSSEARGGVRTRRYGLKGGSLVVLPNRSEEDTELQRIRETFEIETLGWQNSGESVGVRQVELLLYKVFLHLFRVTRTEHKELMREYGGRAGTNLAAKVSAPPSRQAVMNLVGYLRHSGIADVDLTEIPNTPVVAILSSVCIGSDHHPSNSCYFLEGLLGGMVRAKMGASVRVGRVEIPGLSGCCFAVGRVKSLDPRWLSEAVLSSPRRSAINRGRGRA